MKTTGDKIKFFRKRSKLSQLDVETELDMSLGSMSRIESGQTNPTKETLLKLAQLFSLSVQEQMYLLNLTSNPVSSVEQNQAREFVKPIFEATDFLGYLLDDRWILVDFSKGMADLLGLPRFTRKLIRGRNILDLIFSPKSPIYNKIDWETHIEMAEVQLARIYNELSYLRQEPWLQDLLKRILTYPVVQRAHKNLQTKSNFDYLSSKARTAHIQINGKTQKFLYTRELLREHPRFYLMEYTKIHGK